MSALATSGFSHSPYLASTFLALRSMPDKSLDEITWDHLVLVLVIWFLAGIADTLDKIIEPKSNRPSRSESETDEASRVD